MDDLTRLALAAQAGDQTALEEVIRTTQADVWRLCAHLVGEPRADDVTQEAFLRAWRSLPRYRADAGFRTWVLAVARNTAIDALRSARRRPATASELEERAGPAEPDPAGLVTTEHVLAGIDPDRRLALFLTQLLGLSYAEAAAVCGVPVGTIRSRVARGREEFAGHLGLEATS